MGKVGVKVKLDNTKLKAILPIMLQAPTPKYLAMGLGFNSVDTVKNYIRTGEVLQDEFSDKLEELDMILPYFYEQAFEQRIEEYEAEFAQLYNIEPNTPIPDRLYVRHENFILDKKRNFVERKIEAKEQEVLDNIVLSEDEQTDREFKLLIRFSRIYHRCRCMVEMSLLSSVTKHGMTSKNAQLGYKLLQNYNKEEFADTQTVNHTGTVDINSKSILAIAIQQEKEKKLLEQQKQQVIDIKPMPLLSTQENSTLDNTSVEKTEKKADV